MNRTNLFFGVVFLFLATSIVSQNTFVDWKSQVVQYVNVASTPSDASVYNWTEESTIGQGIHINLSPTEIVNIYLEANNSKISFGHFTSNTTVSDYLISLEVNIDNQGYQSLYQGSAKMNHVWNCSPQFNSVGQHNLKVKYITATSSQVYYREYNVKVVPKSDKLFRDQYGNSIRLWKGRSTSSSNYPILLSPGFDAYNTKPEQYYRYAGNELFKCLLNNGFDVYVMYYKFNPQDLRNNAAVYASGVQHISNQLNNGNNIVSAGISMGGLITRYALAKAEDAGTPLPVDKWISLDAPHQGAYISKDLQRLLGDPEPYMPQPSAFDEYANNNPAAKTLLVWNYYEQPPAGVPGARGATFESFFNDLNSLNGSGYPSLTDNIGVSFSTSSTNNVSGTWLEVNSNVKSWNIDIEPYERKAGSFLPLINRDPFVFSLWGLFWTQVTTTQLQNPTFISHNSSLDITGGNSPFDKIIKPNSTHFHDQIPVDIIPDILGALLKDIDYRQNEIVTNDLHVKAGKNIIAGYNVTSDISVGNYVIEDGVRVVFQSKREINLLPGFEVKDGADFETVLDNTFPCGMFNKSAPLLIHEDTPEPATHQDTIFFSSSKTKDDNQELNLYPNPMENSFRIKPSLPFKNDVIVQVINSSGSIVKEVVIPSNYMGAYEIDMTDQTPGIYFCRINGLKNYSTIKLIKI
ncbi:MAG: T9SS type A sorting domain-containing protein [Salibacter sp.]|uniref:T9SS type A sorting domain-containing protein n=1 Tax=Salibacter sp. TaxID=2010995 RepID=UPI00286FBF9E|nr:T9SS type A sorting domain-containing protein [Salibacter sp.]MDR9399240.1 T9SS type A sorting domain-containing protein [Salibacter sp.]